jgi:hypothetical protein
MKRTLRMMFVIAIIIMMGATIGETAKAGRFIVHNSNETVLDTQTNLMWAAKDNGSDISWLNAKIYCESYTGGGYTDWRMPTQDELASLYDANKTRSAPCYGSFEIHVATESIDITCFAPWTSETRGSDASQLNFVNGTQFWYLQSHTYGTRALPVRSNK